VGSGVVARGRLTPEVEEVHAIPVRRGSGRFIGFGVAYGVCGAGVKPYAGGRQARGSSGSRAPDSDPAPHTIAPSASNTTIDPSGIHR
jgi:hypothetical protein